jgi:gamma-glutamylcyclotransferase (GGCT)/AIG2-like uncharacterized protein YtfP
VPTPGTERLPLFVYGTLLDPAVLARMARRRGLHRRAIPARLLRHRRVVLRGSHFPTLVRGRGEVAGMLLTLDHAARRNLALYEGPLYRLQPVRVWCRHGTRDAFAWVAPAWRADAQRAWSPPARVT